jgi:hypothetical protein
MTEEKGLALRQPNIIKSFDDAERAAAAMARSGYFNDSREAAQALVKILAGQEMGFGAFSSMSGIHIIQGRPSIGANLMAAAVKRSGRYDYRVVEMTDKVCSIRFLQHGEDLGVSTFTLEDARKAGTKNLDKFPRNMLFARAMSNGVRWYCPDVFNGSAVYTPEELGANVNEDGEVIDATFTSTQISEQPQTDKPANGNGKAAQPQTEPKQESQPKPERPFAPDALKAALEQTAAALRSPYAQPSDQQQTAAALEQILGGEGQRKELLRFLFGKTSLSAGKPEFYIGHGNVLALARWLKATYHKETKTYTVDETAEHEAKAAHQYALSLNGQGSLLETA